MKLLKRTHVVFILIFVIVAGAFAITPSDADKWSKKRKCRFVVEKIGATIPCGRMECNDYKPIKAVLVGNTITISTDPSGTANGVFLHYVENNTCLWLDATDAHVNNHDVIVSGPFNGCTFAKCVAGGHLYVSHIFKGSYTNSTGDGTVKSNPSEQAAAFEGAIGAARGSAVGFKTKGLLDKIKDPKIIPVGFVMGIYDDASGDWVWRWIVVDLKNNSRVVEYTDITGAANWKPITETN